MANPMTTGKTSIDASTGPMIPAAVMAATDTDPIARCSTAAMSHASRMLRVTGAASSAVKRSARIWSSPVSPMTAPRTANAGDEQDRARGVEALADRRVSAVRAQGASAEHVGTQQPDEQREVGVAEEGDELVGELQELREGTERDHTQRTRVGSRQTSSGGVTVSSLTSSVVSCSTIASSTSSSLVGFQ